VQEHLHRCTGSDLGGIGDYPFSDPGCTDNGISPRQGRQWTDRMEDAGRPAELLLPGLQVGTGCLRQAVAQIV